MNTFNSESLNVEDSMKVFIFNKWVRCHPLESFRKEKQKKFLFNESSAGRTPKPLIGMMTIIDPFNKRVYVVDGFTDLDPEFEILPVGFQEEPLREDLKHRAPKKGGEKDGELERDPGSP